MARKYTSISIETTLSAAVSSSATSLSVASVSALLGDVTLGVSDQFAIAIDPDTVNEEILFVTAANTSTNVLTVVRGRAGTTGISHAAGATVKHVLTGEDLTYFESIASSAITTASTSTLSNKTIALGSNTVSGTIAQFNTAVTDADLATIAGSETLTNKTLTSPVINTPTIADAIIRGTEEDVNVVASAATGTINFDVATASIWYYTSNATANHTLNFRYNSTTSLNTALAVGDAITLVWLNTNGSTPYYPNAIQIDGNAVTPKVPAAITGGNASSIDAYVFTIIKTASATFTVLETQTKFA